MFAQLFYDGEEQFYCASDSCVQSQDASSGSSSYDCDNLKCTCIPNATFCGGVPLTNLTTTINMLGGTVSIACEAPSSDNVAACSFQQSTINAVFGNAGLSLNGCTFGECVRQSVIDISSGNSTSSNTQGGGSPLSGGVIAGLAVVGSLVGLALLFLIWGFIIQRKARRVPRSHLDRTGGASVEWSDVSYFVPNSNNFFVGFPRRQKHQGDFADQKVILDNVSGQVLPGQMMAILGPSGMCNASLCSCLGSDSISGAGKTTLIEILAGKSKSGHTTGSVTFPGNPTAPRVGFVPQQDVLPPMLTVHEALLFAARLRLPENIPASEKLARVDDVLDKLGLTHIRNMRIGDGEKRGISGGEMRRVSIGLELVAKPDVLILDEPTSGLDSVSASKVAKVLHALAHDPENPTAVIASIHQPRSVNHIVICTQR